MRMRIHAFHIGTELRFAFSVKYNRVATAQGKQGKQGI